MKLTLRFNLPANFRRSDFLAFHQRDSHMLAEQWDEKQLHKGIMWKGLPTRLTFSFLAKQLQITCDIDTGPKKLDVELTKKSLRKLIQHMLGINQSTEAFENFAATHADLNSIIPLNPGLRVPQAATPFEALSWAITGQQISVSAAVSLRRKLIAHAGIIHSSGIFCYPDAQHLINLSEDDLRLCSFSASKAKSLINVANLIEAGELPVDQWLDEYHEMQQLPAEQIFTQLVAVRGIGPWTVHYTLLRGFGWLDGSLHGDVVVRRNLQRLLMSLGKFSGDKKISELQTQQWLSSFSPWRALVAAHLWAMQKSEGY